jgi:exodeoxyribonuclease-3
MKVVSFNVNGIRSRLHQIAAVREAHDPDVIGIQETKVVDGDFPREAIAELGYRAHFFGQKTHYGVALLSRLEPVSVRRGYPFDGEEAQRRLITGVYERPGGERVTVVNGYFPQGESRDHPVKFPGKRKFYADLLRYLRESFSPEEDIILLGDMNVAPQDLDVGIGPDNARRWLRTGKCSFLPEEREWLAALADWGLFDTFRTCHAEAGDVFSWFDYRSRGFEREPRRGLRIDFVMASRPLNERCIGAGVDYVIRAMEKPSDHCPVWAEFEV